MHRGITPDLVTEFETGRFTAEFSELQLDRFPEMLQTKMGNGQPLVAFHVERRGDEVRWVDFRQSFGSMELRVFND